MNFKSKKTHHNIFNFCKLNLDFFISILSGNIANNLMKEAGYLKKKIIYKKKWEYQANNL